MQFYNPVTLDHIKEYNGQILKPKIINLEGWNMDADQYGYGLHGLGDRWLIKMYQILIYYDGGVSWKPLDYVVNGVVQAWVNEINDSYFYMERLTGGYFDGAGHDDDGSPRGHCIIWYTET